MASRSRSAGDESKRRVRALSILVGLIAIVGVFLDAFPLLLSVIGLFVGVLGLLWGTMGDVHGDLG